MGRNQSGARSVLATVVGYIILVIVAVLLFNFVLGTIFWLIRTILIVVVLLGLLTLYLKLKSPD